MDKETVVNPYEGILLHSYTRKLFINKNNLLKHTTTDESQNYYVVQNNSVSKAYIDKGSILQKAELKR